MMSARAGCRLRYAPVNIPRLKPGVAEPDNHAMTYGIIPRGKRFWVVHYLADGTYDAIERYDSRVDAELVMKTLQAREAKPEAGVTGTATHATRKVKAR